MRSFPRLVVLLLALGCAPKLRFNQSFLVAEELKVARSGFVSLKSTGESFDFAPIAAKEPGAKRVVLVKLHGTYLLTGDGFRHLWRVWPAGKDEAYFEPVELDPGPDGFLSPTLEMSGECVLVRWQERQAYVNADGDADENACSD
ncbi:MAG: hypothetical protein ACOX6T_12025 [Myxococcales bacterium]